MSKIKIVQVSTACSETETWSEYLDDKGRVWFQVRQAIEGSGVAGVREYEYVWKQVDFPDEPENGMPF